MLLPRHKGGASGGRRSIRRVIRLVHLLAILGSVGVVYCGLPAPGIVLLVVALLVDYATFKLNASEWISAGTKVLLFVLCAALLVSLLLMGPPLVAPQARADSHHHANFPQKRTKSANPITPRRIDTTPRAYKHFPNASHALFTSVFHAALPDSQHPDLAYRPPAEVHATLKQIFAELPASFLARYKNPCWRTDAAAAKPVDEHEAAAAKHRRKALRRKGRSAPAAEEAGKAVEGGEVLHCLPYAYVLGQPKCGTSDLFERLKSHPSITMPARKEVRWFTRGEFTRSRMELEQPPSPGSPDGPLGDGSTSRLLGPGSSVFSFTRSFQTAARDIAAHPASHITLDGGPHTLWWPTQSPDGAVLREAVPTPQILREMQPDARFVLTLSDPVRRLYSDYYFLDDNLRVHRPGQGEGGKSAAQLGERVSSQIAAFQACVHKEEQRAGEAGAEVGGAEGQGEAQGRVRWFRASQACAHDRHAFAVAGWGRLSIGLYSLFLAKWLEHFPPSQFLVLRLEDYEADPKAYMRKVVAFLGLDEPSESAWAAMLNKRRANAYSAYREPILPETEAALRAFYAPYNDLLSRLLVDQGFLWAAPEGGLRKQQLESAQRGEEEPGAEEETDKKKAAASERRAVLLHSQRLSALNSTGAEEGHADAVQQSSRRNAHGHMHHNGDDDDDTTPFPATAVMRPKRKTHIIPYRQEGIPSPDSPQFAAAHQQQQQEEEMSAPRKLVLRPEAFSLEGLATPPADFNLWLRDGKYIDRENPLLDEADAAEQICIAAFALDLAAVKYLLWEKGIPADLVNEKDAGRNAFHCLALVHIMADAHGKSQIFALLKGRTTWLTPYLDPPMNTSSRSVLARDIVEGTSAASLLVAAWLTRAGVDCDVSDSTGNTPLHHASAGGQRSLALYLIAHGADVHRANREGRTPLHYACSYGHAQLAGDLVAAGAGLDVEDKFGSTPRAIVSGPGPVMAADAQSFLNITQRPPRSIRRLLHPERRPQAKGGWRAGTGGWGTARLAGYEDDMSCQIDQYWAHELTAKQLFEQYISRMAPVLIRGLLDDWPAAQHYSHANLTANHGSLRVQVSDIPYADKFGGQPRQDMLLSEYIAEVRGHRMVGGSHPWYVFKGNRVPFDSERSDSLVQYDWTPTPDIIQKAIEYLNPPTARGYTGARSREVFINAQWAIGGEGTGAPVHYHNTAWNALVFGAKKWVVYPPHSMIMSNRQIREYFETDLKGFSERGVEALSCVQTAGDVMIVPEIWGHGVLNLQESVAVATESKSNHWRIKPASQLLNKLPSPRP